MADLIDWCKTAARSYRVIFGIFFPDWNFVAVTAYAMVVFCVVVGRIFVLGMPAVVTSVVVMEACDARSNREKCFGIDLLDSITAAAAAAVGLTFLVPSKESCIDSSTLFFTTTKFQKVAPMAMAKK
jgi:hypothetical protein